MIVADCTVIVRLLVRADPPAAVDALMEEHPVWAVPALWQAEFTSALLKYERARRLDPILSSELLKRAIGLLGETTFQIQPHRVLEMARSTTCSAYDSHYLALAADLRIPLYTHDEELLRKCPGLARRPE